MREIDKPAPRSGDIDAALRESERRYRTLAEAAQDAIFIVGHDGRVSYANEASIERFGLAGDVVGSRLFDLLPPGAADEIWREASAVFAGGGRRSLETSFAGPNGTVWMETWLVPMLSEGEEPDAVMGVVRDITARKLLEGQLLQSQKMEAIGQLAGGIAHDFNNILTAILGYSELLLDRVGQDEALAADIEEVKKAGERAGRLTRQLLAFGRKQVLTAQVLDLSEVVTELQKMLGRVIGEDVDLRIVAPQGLDRVKVDPGQMEQVIVNLAVNARDAMPRGGTLTIATENVVVREDDAERHRGVTPGRYVMLSVRDTGCGMSSEVLAHVFEPFFTTKPVGRGTGLGLATVYGIVKQSGGHIGIDSAPSRGTTVRIYMASVGDAAAAQSKATGFAAARGSETILLVEDEAGVRHLMHRTLERSGYTVLKAPTVGDALALALDRDRHIDLLVSDVVMPDLSGPDIAQRVLRLHPSARVLYVSGFTNHIPLDSGALNRPAAFLPKPFTPQALAAKVRECLDAAV